MLSRNGSAISKRAQSVAAAARSVEEKVSRLPNGLTVASVDLEGAASQLVIAFRAGSRYEARDEKGLVHHARVMAGTDSHKFKGLQLVWNTAVNGGNLTASSTRDVLAVQMTVPRDGANVGMSILGEAAAQTSFEPWVIEENLPFVKQDTVGKCHKAMAVEDLHRAAYRNGPLANSNFAASSQIGKLKYNKFQDFVSRHYVSGNAVLVGVNVDHNELLAYATDLAPINEGAAVQPKPSDYFGGEFRRETSGNKVFIAVAGQGASLQSVNDIAVQAVVSQLVGNIKVANATVDPLSVQYSDSGLVGAVIVSGKETAGAALKYFVSSMKGLKSDDTSLAAAKRKAAIDVLVANEKSSVVALDTAIQVLARGSAASPAEIAEAITKVSANDVAQALKKVTSKLSIAANGDLSTVPYLDEL